MEISVYTLFRLSFNSLIHGNNIGLSFIGSAFLGGIEGGREALPVLCGFFNNCIDSKVNFH